jgi:hypothetical protein
MASTPVVVTVKVAEVWPDAIVTVLGTMTELLVLVKDIDRPFAGAALPIVIVPIVGLPPTTVVGLRLKVPSDGGWIVS